MSIKFTDFLQIGMYTLYTLLNNVCKFHKDQTSSLPIPAVLKS